MYSEQLLDHFKNPRRAGVLSAPTLAVVQENPACGDVLKLSVRIESGRIEDAAFQVKGCTASIACGSALADWLVGQTLEALRQADHIQVVTDLVGGLPEASTHAARLAADAVAALLRQAKA